MSSIERAHPATTAESRLRAGAIAVALVAILAVGAWLRFHAIEAKSLWTDEGVSAAFTRLGWYDFVRILWRREANMTLYYLLLRAWSHLGDSAAMLRAFSVLPSLGTIPLIYLLGRRLFSTGVGLTAALLLAVNAYSVRYAQEVRSYSLVTFLVVLATYLFVRAVESGRKRDWTWYVVASALAVYAHFFAVLMVIAHWASLVLLAKAPAGQDTGATTAVLAAFRPAAKRIALWTLPIWIFIATTGAGPVKWIQRPGARDLYSFFEQLSGNAGARLFWLYLACTVIAVATTVRLWRRGGPGAPSEHAVNSSGMPEPWRYALPLLWFTVPVAVTLAFSLARPVFLPRYMNICLPALVLMVAIGLNSFRQRWLGLAVLALICWFAVGGVQAYYLRDFDIGREDYRGASEYVMGRAQAGDRVLFFKGLARFPFSYYVDHSTRSVRPSIVFPGTDQPSWRSFMGKITPQVLNDVAAEQTRVWLVLTETVEPSSDAEVVRQIKAAAASTHRLTEVRQFDYVRVYLYEPK